MASTKFHNSIRKYHRWLGFFLAGMIAIYSVSGILLIFRKTDFLQFPQTEIHQLEPGLQTEALAKTLRIRNFKVESDVKGVIMFNSGQYDKHTGEAVINTIDYPMPLAKLVNLHKATHNSPLFFLNISFGVALLFFVVSAFLMFMPKLPFFKNGVKISLAGALFALLFVIFAS
ncbi:hypothetical protein [uncultured Paraglaciecola sp.]|uniref:hypothetical protein n=1 Tax=uncultured Paraglaciecola sp. TaxID=1765024 RepID=UPI00262EF414|nr:hypothetical protein [uncultured Paraglaciecola sp.]